MCRACAADAKSDVAEGMCEQSSNLRMIKEYGVLAQLGARHTGSVEVTGSNPVCSILFLLINDSVNYL